MIYPTIKITTIKNEWMNEWMNRDEYGDSIINTIHYNTIQYNTNILY
jgi:hypothetical protein